MNHRTYASINIYSTKTSPDSMAEMFSLKADRAVTMGETIRRDTIAKQNAWIYTSKDRIESDELADHIEYLLDRFDGKNGALHDILDNSGWMRILCFWESPDGNGGPVIPAKLLKKLSMYPFDLDFDIWT